jgi:hypothetical protein
MCWMIARRTRHCLPPPRLPPTPIPNTHQHRHRHVAGRSLSNRQQKAQAEGQQKAPSRGRQALSTQPAAAWPASLQSCSASLPSLGFPTVLLGSRATGVYGWAERGRDLLVLGELDDGREERVGQALNADDPVHRVQLADDVEPRLQTILTMS